MQLVKVVRSSCIQRETRTNSVKPCALRDKLVDPQKVYLLASFSLTKRKNGRNSAEKEIAEEEKHNTLYVFVEGGKSFVGKKGRREKVSPSRTSIVHTFMYIR